MSISLNHAISGGISAIISSDGEDFLVAPSGTTVSLVFVTGDVVESFLGTTPTFEVEVAMSTDVAHDVIGVMFDCLQAGQAETPDNVLAAQRFEDYATEADVWNTQIGGDDSSGSYGFRIPDGTTVMHIAMLGGSSYTEAAGATIAEDEFVALTIPGGAVGVAVSLATSDTGGSGTEKSHRKIGIQCFSPVA